jgi:hypothetical protein
MPYTTQYGLPIGALYWGEVQMLAQYSTGVNLSVELGTYCGLGAMVLSINSEQVVTIDVFEDVNLIDTNCIEHYTKLFKDFPHYYNVVKDEVLIYCANATVIKGLTYADYNYNNVDVLFIDADHSYEGVKRDFNAWFNKVSLNGVIILHDTYGQHNGGWVGCEQFANEQIGNNKLQLLERKYVSSVFRKVAQ